MCRLLAPAVAVVLLLTACQTLASSSPMEVGSLMPPPSGFVEFCMRNPGECSETGGRRATVDLTAERSDQLANVQWAVNGNVRAARDSDQYGRREFWAYPQAGYGDCEDFALEKRRRLIALGWPKSSLLLTFALTEKNRAHIVLVAATNKGDYVLDNRMKGVVPWYALPYTWLGRQSEEAETVWVRAGIKDSSIRAAAARRSRAPIVSAGVTP